MERFEKEQMAEMFFEAVEEFFFHYLPDGLRKFLDERSATGLMYYIVSEGSANSIGKKMKEVIGEPKESLKMFFTMFKVFGRECELETEEGENEITFRIKKCPHDEFAEKNPLVCVACVASLAGIMKAYFKKAEVHVDGRRLGVAGAPVKIVKEGAPGSCSVTVSWRSQ